MAYEELQYNIHNVLGITVKRKKRPDLVRGSDLELAAFRGPFAGRSDIVFNVGNFHPSSCKCIVIDHKYYVGDNYFFTEDSADGLQWKVEITGFETDQVTVNYAYKTLRPRAVISSLSPETFLLKPLIFFRLHQKQYLMVHAAAACRNSQAVVFPGRGGCFKTSLVMDMLNWGGFAYLGDDWVILKEKEVLSFPAHLPLFSYAMQQKKDEFLTLTDKVRFISSFPKNGPISGNFPLAERAILGSVYFLARNQESIMDVQELTVDSAVAKLIANNKLEMSAQEGLLSGFTLGPCYRYLLAYSFALPTSRVAHYWEDVREKFKEIFKGVAIYNVKVPSSYTVKVFEDLVDLMEVNGA